MSDIDSDRELQRNEVNKKDKETERERNIAANTRKKGIQINNINAQTHTDTNKQTNQPTHRGKRQPCVRICEFRVNNANYAKQQITFPIDTAATTTAWLAMKNYRAVVTQNMKRNNKQTKLYYVRPINRPHFSSVQYIGMKGMVLNSLATVYFAIKKSYVSALFSLLPLSSIMRL